MRTDNFPGQFSSHHMLLTDLLAPKTLVSTLGTGESFGPCTSSEVQGPIHVPGSPTCYRSVRTYVAICRASRTRRSQVAPTTSSSAPAAPISTQRGTASAT